MGRGVLERRAEDPDPNELADWYKEELAQESADMEVDAGLTSDENIDPIGNFEAAHGLCKLEPDFDDEFTVTILNKMGGSGRSFRREACSAARRIVTEVDSPLVSPS